MAADVVDAAKRSQMMSGIRSKNTKPEMVIRRGLHQLGFRYLVHDRRLPGAPDIVLPKWKAVVFVHGCFWHGHDCALFRLPATRSEFWRTKIDANRARDLEVENKILELGWRVLKIWECSIKGKSGIGLHPTLQIAEGWIMSGEKSGSIRGL